MLASAAETAADPLRVVHGCHAHAHRSCRADAINAICITSCNANCLLLYHAISDWVKASAMLPMSRRVGCIAKKKNPPRRRGGEAAQGKHQR